jgi:hypothetical protein
MHKILNFIDPFENHKKKSMLGNALSKKIFGTQNFQESI